VKLTIFIVDEKPRPETGHFYSSWETTPWNWPFLLFMRNHTLKLAIFIFHEKLRLELAILNLHLRKSPTETDHFYCSLEATPWNWPFLLFISSCDLKLAILLFIRSYALKLAIFIFHEKLRLELAILNLHLRKWPPETDHFYCSLEATAWNWPFLLYIRSCALKLAILLFIRSYALKLAIFIDH